MTEETARERFGADAVKVEGSLEVRKVGGGSNIGLPALAAEVLAMTEALKACPACGKKQGEVLKTVGARFPFMGICRACGWTTPSVKLESVAVKLWNTAKKPR